MIVALIISAIGLALVYGLTTAVSAPSASFTIKANTNNGGTLPVQPGLVISQNYSPGLSQGTSAGQVNIAAIYNLSVVNGTPYTLNLSTGPDQYGNTLGMTTFIGYQLINTTSSGGSLVIGKGTDPAMGANDEVTVQAAGGCAQVINPGAGWAVVGSTSDTLQITSSSGTATGQLVVFGR